MRPIKELLQIVLKEYEKKYSYMSIFICNCVACLRHNEIITEEESMKLESHILNNRPKRGKFYDPRCKEYDQFFNSEDKQIRIEWLKHLISEL